MPKAEVQPYWHNPDKRRSVINARTQVRGALTKTGEYTAFLLKWSTHDYEADLVAICPTCLASDAVARYLDHTPDPKCPDCLGTTYEGGYKAILVREAIWADTTEEDDTTEVRGEETKRSAQVHTGWDFRLRKGDWIMRADNTRWSVQRIDKQNLHVGFGLQSRSVSLMAYTYQVVLENDSTVAYLAPPSAADLATLNVPTPDSMHHTPDQEDWSAIEDVRGPVLEPPVPLAAPDPAPETPPDP